MFIKSWIFLTVLVAVAYAASAPLTLRSLEESTDVSQPEQHVRQKRFILAKKALLAGGALGFGAGLVKGKLLGGGWHHQPVHYYPVYHETVYHEPVYVPVYREPVYAPAYGHGGGHGGGWASASAYASAGSSSW